MGRNILIVAIVIVVVAGAAWLKHRGPSGGDSATADPAAGTLPRLVELGAGKCTACKEMKPIIEELRKEYTGRLRVDSFDVIEQAEQAAPFNWKLIPCQVFLDPDGRELWRHEGFISRVDILAEWAELGFKLDDTQTQPGA